MIIDAVVCRICHQRPWRVEGREAVADYGYVMRAWCHGAFRRWFIGAEVVAADRWDLLARALEAFPPMLRALPPVLVAIRRLRGRRLPPPERGRLIVWCM